MTTEAAMSYNASLRAKITDLHREIESLTCENAQLRVFQAKAALAASELTLCQMDLRTEKRLLDGKIKELSKSEARMNFYWESTDLIREAIEFSINKNIPLDPTKLMNIIDRPDTEGLFE